MMRMKYLMSPQPCFKKCCIYMYDTGEEGGKGGKEEDEKENKETLCDRVLIRERKQKMEKLEKTQSEVGEYLSEQYQRRQSIVPK